MESQLLPWAGTLRAQWRQVPVRHRGLDGWRIIITVEHLTGELPTPPKQNHSLTIHEPRM